MIHVTLFVREECPPCEQAQADLQSLQEEIPHQLSVVNVENDQGLMNRYGSQLPVVEIGPYHLRSPFTRQDLKIMLSAARDRIDQIQRVDQEAYESRLEKGSNMSGGDKATRFISHHYLALVNGFLLLYFGLPFLAPVLMRSGSDLAATIIYRIYSPMCHQLAFRSWFLFGEQPFYPRELSGVDGGLISYEELSGSNQVNLYEARAFTGNEMVGYKVALCQRDVAIYGFMLLFGIVFAITGRKLKPLPWYIWIIVGMGPIALDGFSQLPGLASNLPAWLPNRESTPLLRTITGGLFGWMTAWYLFPMLEATASEARKIFYRKEAAIRSKPDAQNRL